MDFGGLDLMSEKEKSQDSLLNLLESLSFNFVKWNW